jgi:GAF domain-containing protein
MPQDEMRIKVMLFWQTAVKEATTFARVEELAVRFAREQVGAETAVLSQSPNPAMLPAHDALRLPVGHTGYCLALSRGRPFTAGEKAVAEMASTLLAAAPFFATITDPARARFLEIVHGVAEIVRSAEPLPAILEKIRSHLLAAFSASSSFVALYEAENGHIVYPILFWPQPQTLAASLHSDSLAAWVVVNGLPYVTINWEKDTWPATGLAHERLTGSVMCLPLFYGDEVLGALGLQADAPHAFQEADFEILTAVAEYVATAVHNARLQDRTDALIRKSTEDYQTAVSLRQAVSLISSALEQNAVVNNLLIALNSVLAYDVAHVFLWNQDRLEVAASYDTANRPLAHSPRELEAIWRRSPLMEQMRQSKEAILLQDPALDPRWRPFSGSQAIKSWLGVPLVAGNDVSGALIIQSAQSGAFGKQQQWLSATLASHTAVALQNAALYRQTQRQYNQLSTLYQASATMSANLDQGFVLQSVVEAMTRALQVDTCIIFVWDKLRQHLIPMAHNGSDSLAESGADGKTAVFPTSALSHIAQLEQNPIIQRVFKSKQSYDLQADQVYSAERQELLSAAGLQSLLLVPLVRGDAILGLLALGQENVLRAFSDDDQRLAQNLAGQAAIAIEHAHLYSQAQRRVEELATFHNIVLKINTPLQQRTVLDAITESALKLVDATNLHIYLYDAVTQTFSFGSALWRDGRRHAAVPAVRPHGMTATVVHRGEPLIINNAAEHPLFQEEGARAWGIQAIAGFPLKRGTEVLGAFTITYLHPHTFTKDEVLLLNLLADQAAVAVHNAQLFAISERRLRDMSALVDMAQQITGKLKIRAVLQTTVEILQQLLNARASTITMLSENHAELMVAAAVGVKQEYTQARMPIEDSISGQVVQTGELVYIRDSYQEPEFVFFSEIVRSLLVVPLIVRGETIGTLSLDSDRPNAFSDSDIQLLLIAAAQVGIAISNAGLFEEVEARAAELTVAYDELKESDRLKDELVQNVSHELRTPLTFVKGYVDLLMDGEMGLVTPAQQDALQIVATKTDEITRLIDDIITLQRIDAGNLQMGLHSMVDVVQTAVANHSIVAEKRGLSVKCNLPAEITPILLDKGRINQVIDNLITNAMKFSPDGGVITVTLRESENELRVIVSDQGIGMPKEKQARIFDRFYQIDGSARRRFGGTGIGLAIVKRIVDAHKGKIWVESELNQGSSFYFTLPKTKHEALAEEEPAQPAGFALARSVSA